MREPMRRRLPPMEQIEAFVEAGRAPSFRVAAERCALSPAAFSRRVQGLAASLGFELFERTAGGLKLTRRAAKCLQELTPAYLELRRAVTAVVEENLDRDTVRLSISRSLATGWLFPRLADFESENPQIRISIETQGHNPAQLHGGAADLGIFFSNFLLEGVALAPLLNVHVTPVANPTVASQIAGDKEVLRGLPLLTHSTLPDLWRWWATSVGYDSPSGRVSSFETVNESYEVASRMPSVTMGCFPTVCSYLQEERLRPLGLPVANYPGGYWLAATPAARTRSAVRVVWDWLESEARNTRCTLDTSSRESLMQQVRHAVTC